MNFFNNKLPNILAKIFTKSNIKKILIIFIVGLISRIFVNYMYNINVFISFLNYISLTYYLIFSIFIVLVHGIVDHFDITMDVNPYYKPTPKLKIPTVSQMDQNVPNPNHNPNLNSSSSNNYANSKLLPVKSGNKFLSEDVNELRESRNEASRRRRVNARNAAKASGRPRGEITKLRREAKLASDQRWEKERSLYPGFSHRSWLLQIDNPRVKANELVSNNNVLPSISSLAITSTSYNTSVLDRNLDLPSMLNNPVSNSQGNNNYTDSNQSNQSSTNNTNND